MTNFNEYFLMEEKDVLLYVKNKLKYFSQNDNITCKEIGDGNINYVYRISNGKDSIILKQAGVHTRSNSSGRILDINRNAREAEILSFYVSILPDLAPKIISIDKVMNLFVMEDLKSFLILRDALMKGQLKENVFSESLNKFVEDNLYNNKQIQLEAAKLKYEFMNNPQALIHGDLHTGSIFVDDDYIKVMDCEFAFYGPIGYDLGTIMANFIFSYVYHLHVTKDRNYTSFLFKVIDDILRLFKNKFITKFLHESNDISAQNDYFIEYYLLEVLKTGFGICGLELLRRTTGCARVKEIESVTDPDIRRNIEFTLLNIGIECLSYRDRLSEEEKFMKFVDNIIDNIDL